MGVLDNKKVLRGKEAEKFFLRMMDDCFDQLGIHEQEQLADEYAEKYVNRSSKHSEEKRPEKSQL